MRLELTVLSTHQQPLSEVTLGSWALHDEAFKKQKLSLAEQVEAAVLKFLLRKKSEHTHQNE